MLQVSTQECVCWLLLLLDGKGSHHLFLFQSLQPSCPLWGHHSCCLSSVTGFGPIVIPKLAVSAQCELGLPSQLVISIYPGPCCALLWWAPVQSLLVRRKLKCCWLIPRLGHKASTEHWGAMTCPSWSVSLTVASPADLCVRSLPWILDSPTETQFR